MSALSDVMVILFSSTVVLIPNGNFWVVLLSPSVSDMSVVTHVSPDIFCERKRTAVSITIRISRRLSVSCSGRVCKNYLLINRLCEVKQCLWYHGEVSASVAFALAGTVVSNFGVIKYFTQFLL